MTETITHTELLEAKLKPLYDRLANHRLYRSFRTLNDLHAFMESHVFAVWDFMSLLKALQRGLTCVDVPWVPSRSPETRRLVNEIVLGEETDMYNGQSLSHFELYLLAMRHCGANTAPVESFVERLRQQPSVAEAMQVIDGIPEPARHFVRDTFCILEEAQLHITAAAFTFGREDLIPAMFKGFVRDLNRDLGGDLDTFLWYLERHIEVDGEHHGPMALRMISELCGDDEGKWQEAERAAIFALESRLRLWDGIADSIAPR